MVKVREDLTGKTFGRLTVIKQVEDYITPKGAHFAKWLCQCECGNTTEVVGHRLKKGQTTSCGCYAIEKLIERSKKQNPAIECGDYVTMYTLKGEEFYVDIDDYEKVKNICWHKHHSGYIINRDGLQIHRLIMNPPDNMDVDHIHGDKSRNDNRKSNLRIVSTSQNCMNKRMMKTNTSGTVGVTWHKQSQRWRAIIGINGEYIYIGGFINKDDAIKARKEAEDKYFGEYSYDNSQKCNRGDDLSQ